MLKENELLRSLMSQPLSIYFDAYRTEVKYLFIYVSIYASIYVSISISILTAQRLGDLTLSVLCLMINTK